MCPTESYEIDIPAERKKIRRAFNKAWKDYGFMTAAHIMFEDYNLTVNDLFEMGFIKVVQEEANDDIVY